MTLLDVLLVTAAGFAAGIINTAVGSGSLITYPMMVLVGVPPVAANISNTVGLAPGAVLGAWVYRHEIALQRTVATRTVPLAVLGATVGAVLLVLLPAAAFQFVVPVLILFATVLVAAQPAIARRVGGTDDAPRRTWWGPLAACVLGASIYGGYFSAAQGVILLGVLGVFLSGGLQEHNAMKNLLAATVNVVAAVLFLILGGTDWLYAACVAVGALIGAPVGARIARRLPARFFRVAIVVFGLVVTAVMVARLVH